MLSKIILFVKDHQEEIVIFIAVFLISLISFGLGYIVSENQKEDFKIENIQNEE